MEVRSRGSSSSRLGSDGASHQDDQEPGLLRQLDPQPPVRHRQGHGPDERGGVPQGNREGQGESGRHDHADERHTACSSRASRERAWVSRSRSPRTTRSSTTRIPRSTTPTRRSTTSRFRTRASRSRNRCRPLPSSSGSSATRTSGCAPGFGSSTIPTTRRRTPTGISRSRTFRPGTYTVVAWHEVMGQKERPSRSPRGSR